MNYLIAGLGNIGKEYELTRHNVGFEVADMLAREFNTSFEIDRHAFVARFRHKARNICLLKPTTYMNLSGKAVSHWMKTEKVPLENILVVTDDLAIPFGKLRMRAKGSPAGHNGLKSIDELLQTQQYARLRFGIGDSFPKGRQVDYVLGRFSAEEQAGLDMLLRRAADMCLSFVSVGVNLTMNQYNE